MERDNLYNEIALLNPVSEHETIPTTLRMRKGPADKNKLQVRILWPALGFPAVINPDSRSTKTPLKEGDARNCICLLLLSNKMNLGADEIARNLRYVPWSDRSRRHIGSGQTGSFSQYDIEVRNEESEHKLIMPNRSDVHGTEIMFGANYEGENGISVKLSDFVKKFYDKNELKYLHEVRVFEKASAIGEGHYNLFWNSDDLQENRPSDELKLLLDQYALPNRENDVLWETQPVFLLGEYEYEYGSLQKPYGGDQRTPKIRTEVLHPLFVKKPWTKGLTIGHITDTHVCVRANVYEENLKGANKAALYNNWNKNFVKAYGDARKASDILLLTGDLVDYGRGHWGLTAKDKLGEDLLYHRDRNWFLFYYLFASKDSYSKPAYTILGNHDWRPNPYPPFAIAGAPSSTSFFHNHIWLDKDTKKGEQRETQRLLKIAHGDGVERKFTYYLESDKKFMEKFWQDGSLLKTAAKIVANKKTLDEPHLPVETKIESVGWYLMIINPFLDYSFCLPGGQKVLMLDWAEDEDLFFPLTIDGSEWPFLPWDVKKATLPGPKARNSLTPLQKNMLDDFISSPGTSKVIGIHAPPVGPYPDWSDLDLLNGKKIYGPKEKARGPKGYFSKKVDGRTENWNGHPIYALPPDKDEFGTTADYGSLSRERDWFIKQVVNGKSGVRAIFSGHIHRNGLYYIHIPATEKSGILKGKMLVGSLYKPDQFTFEPAKVKPSLKTLFVNTTSSGPRGGFYARKENDREQELGGQSNSPGFSQVEMATNGDIRRVMFLRTPG